MSALLTLLLALQQEDLTVLKPADQPKKMLETFLLAECAKFFETRRKAVAEFRTPEDVLKRQQDLRARFIAALGGFPEKTPLNGRVTGKADRDGYRIEKVIYESRPDHHVTAILYLPPGRGPFPGVIMPMGHSVNGKAADYAQKGSILLAKNGIACLNYDPIGQGERMQLLDASGNPAIKGSTTEHTLIGTGALLVGWSAASFRIWDGIRSLDYLAGRPEIDPKRLGCTGCSGGGTLTSYLMALDERIFAAAPSCYLTSLERLFATIGPQDAEQNITGQVAFGMEHADYVLLHAPRPTLMLTGTRDFFDIQGAWTTFREAKKIYGIFGHAERMDLAEFDQPHGYPKTHREGAVRWMRRWLLGVDDAIVEPDLPIEKDQDLWCTPTGQVLSSLKGKSAFDLTADRAAELAGKRGGMGRAELLAEVRRLIGIETTWTPVREAQLLQGVLQRNRYVIRKGYAETEPGVKVPFLNFAPEKSDQRSVLYVAGEGKAAASGPVERLAQAGFDVEAPDLRGVGETAGSESKEAFLSIHLARPLLGQRVKDVLTFVARKQKVHAVGTGAAAPVVLHAAALDERIEKVTLEGMVLSWTAVARTPLGKGQLANVVPGALKSYDLPDLAASIAPRPLTIQNPVDAAGRPVSQADLEAAYATAREAYKAAGAEKNLVLEAQK
jgi:dienelactone hydrolase/pimeloyl-ACP methyl ester carboxylesterase